ncbi:MAG: hypothetical protein V4446_06060 [Pseudomonadota bacterium]
MKTQLVIALTAICTASPWALAALPDPADASVAVPAPQYVSPLSGYSIAPDSTSPDKNWRAANAAAAQQDSMAGMDMSGMDMSDPDARKATKP